MLLLDDGDDDDARRGRMGHVPAFAATELHSQRGKVVHYGISSMLLLLFLQSLVVLEMTEMKMMIMMTMMIVAMIVVVNV